MDSIKIGQFIAKLRKEQNLNQIELGEKINISNKTISKWETGRGIPDSDSLIELSNTFNVSINEILLGEKKNEENKKELEIIPIKLLNEKQKKIKRIISISIFFIMTLITLFLGYYFINNYNSINVYKISGNDYNLYITDGIMIVSREKIYIKLDPINSNSKIKKISIFYKKNRKNKILYSNEDNDINNLIINNFNNNEIYTYNDLKYIKKSLFLELTFYDDNTISIPLKLEKDFSNTKIIQ